MRVLVACEFSGVVRDAFLARGHDAWSCDLLQTERPGSHIQGDVLALLDQEWDMMIAHPPCTYLCNSGRRWLYTGGRGAVVDKARWAAMEAAAVFFRRLLDAPISRIAVENPIMHDHARRLIGIRQTQIVQPWMFGHGETKATGLWLRGALAARATHVDAPLFNVQTVMERTGRIHRLSPSADRGKIRSVTYAGIAAAMAEQWGSL